MFFLSRYLPLNTKQDFESLYNLIVGERLLSIVKVVTSFSVDKPLDFHDITYSILLSIFIV